MPAWRGWYHCTGSTYGTWLRGDPRGWRARHHREHVNGDYKNPPTADIDRRLLARSRNLMKRACVVLMPEQRVIACRAFGQALMIQRVELIDLCVGGKHWHGLMRFPFSADRTPSARKMIGVAKKHSARALSDAGLVAEGGVWAARCRCRPVKDRAHQLNIVRYIRDHARSGTAVWSVLQATVEHDPFKN